MATKQVIVSFSLQKRENKGLICPPLPNISSGPGLVCSGKDINFILRSTSGNMEGNNFHSPRSASAYVLQVLTRVCLYRNALTGFSCWFFILRFSKNFSFHFLPKGQMLFHVLVLNRFYSHAKPCTIFKVCSQITPATSCLTL